MVIHLCLLLSKKELNLLFLCKSVCMKSVLLGCQINILNYVLVEDIYIG